MSQPHFFARKVQNRQRQSARLIACPLCDDQTETFANASVLRRHAISVHPEIAKQYPNGAGWRDYAEQANQLPQTVRRVMPEKHAVTPSGGDSDGESMQPHPDSQSQLDSSSGRPLSASGQGYTESFDKLSITPDPSSATGRSNAPLRRSGASPTRQQPLQPESPVSPRSRRTKGPSDGQRLMNREQVSPRRTTTNKRLWSPQSDSPYDRIDPPKLRDTKPPFSSHGRYQSQTSKELTEAQQHPQDRSISRASNVATIASQSTKPTSIPLKAAPDEDEIGYDTEPELLLQPETRPISHEQLVVEVKGIYAGLVMVEAKCIDVDDKQTIAAQERDPEKRTKLTPEQWSALIALHKTLLHEHHDFFLASQHPAASPALSRLAAKYSMPARMWRHGIHAFLEVLRYRLPESLDHMLAFIYIAYSMMALLYETVDAFQDTWIECLGDLGRYRMAIEDDDVRDREVWSGVARFWYNKAAERNPQLGRLPHHLAILSRPFTIQQLSLYCRSLTCIVPFENARTSIMSVFTPVLEGRESVFQRSNTTEVLFIHVHAILFTGGPRHVFQKLADQLLAGDQFSKFIARAGPKFKEIGVCVGLANIAALHQHGATNEKGIYRSLLRLRFEEARHSRETATMKVDETTDSATRAAVQRVENLTAEEQEASLTTIDTASIFTFGIMSMALKRRNDGQRSDKNVFPLIHVYIIFIWYAASIDGAMELVERNIPWTDLVTFLNSTMGSKTMNDRVLSMSFPVPANGSKGRPLPEDYVMRGQLHTETYFPQAWFENAEIDDEERILELPSFQAPRTERILWAAHKIAEQKRWMTWDETTGLFSETTYIRNLPAWNPSMLIQSSTLVDDTAMVDANEAHPPFSGPATTQSSPSHDHQHKTRPVVAPTMILKRERKSEPRDDVEMRDPSYTKEEIRNPVTEAWLNTGQKPNDPDFPTKSEPGHVPGLRILRHSDDIDDPP